MPHPFFDAIAYPWHRPDAQAAHSALYQAITLPNDITLTYRQCGENLTPLTPGQAANLAWREVLELLTTARRLKRLCELLPARAEWPVLEASLQAVENARDLLEEPLLSRDLVFVDRKRLRTELQKLSGPTPSHGVLLVRGDPSSGKSWTQYLVEDMATALGAKCIYLFDGIVSTLDEVLEQLFTGVGDATAVPARLESEDAWFKRACVKLQAVAQKNGQVCWIVADDLGLLPTGPRLDPQIRQFFEQFALSMANPAFARWFRLVLIDYPDGPVPTKWKSFWVEDRTQPAEVDEKSIADFVLNWAARKKKKLGADDAQKLAVDILANVSQPTLPDGPSRLARIHQALEAALEKL